MWEISPEFSAAGLGVGIALVAYMALGDPFLGRSMFRRLNRTRDSDPRALTRFYGTAIAAWAAITAVAAAAVLLSPGVSFADLGFQAGDPESLQFWVIVPLALAVVMGAVIQVVVLRSGKELPGLAEIGAMLPRTAAERRLAVGCAIAEGIGAHIVLRGLIIALALDLVGGIPGVVAGAAASIVITAAGGWYRGRRVVLGAGVLGLLLTGLYVASSSLLLPAGLHILMIIRDLLVPSAGRAPKTQPEGV